MPWPEEPYARLEARLAELDDLGAALHLLGWDQQTMMPPGGAQARAEVMASLERITHERATDDALFELLEELRPWAETLPEDDARGDVVRVARRDAELARLVPSELSAEITLAAAEEVRRFGITPKVALLSASNFGSAQTASSRKMQRALELIRGLAPELEIDGEMHGDAALSEEIRLRVCPNTRLRGEANLFVMPTLDAANIAFNLLKTAAGGGVTIGPMLLGAARPVHILTPSATVRRLVNMTALAVADANAPRGQEKGLF